MKNIEVVWVWEGGLNYDIFPKLLKLFDCRYYQLKLKEINIFRCNEAEFSVQDAINVFESDMHKCGWSLTCSIDRTKPNKDPCWQMNGSHFWTLHLRKDWDNIQSRSPWMPGKP